MKHRFTAVLLAVLLVIGCLTGCGDKEQSPQTDSQTDEKPQAAQTKYAYRAEYVPLELGEYQIQYINDTCIAGDTLFFLATCMTGKELMIDEITGEPYVDENGQTFEVEQSTTRLFSMKLDGTGIQQLDYVLPEPQEGSYGYGYAGGLIAGKDGSIRFYDRLQSYRFDLPEDFDYEVGNAYDYYVDEGTSVVCYEYDTQGNRKNSVTLSTEKDTYLGMVLLTPDGEIYASDWMSIWRYNKEGQSAGTLSLENGFNNLQIMRDGSVGVSVWQENGLVLNRLDPATMTLDEGAPLPDTAYNLLPGVDDYDYLYESNGSIYGLRGSNEPEKLFSWLDCDVDTSYMNNYEIANDGTVYAFETLYESEKNEFNLIVMRRVDASTLPEKQILTLACLYLDWNVRTEIIKFNKAHDDVRIVVADYSEYATEEDYAAGLQKLNTEILSGVVPDIFFIDENMPIDVYAAKGILLDLWPLIDADPEIGRDDLMTHFFDSISVDNKLYRIVDTFAIETVIGRADVVGTNSGWNLDELMAAYGEMEPGASIFGEMDVKEQMMNMIIERSSNDYVDWENKSCSFDSQEFTDLLNLVNSFPETFDYENYDWQDYQSEGLRMRLRKQLLQRASVSSFDTIQYHTAMTDGMPSYIGYPSRDGSGSNFAIYGGFALSAGCENQNAAWEFVRRYLTEEYQINEYMYQFPTNRHAFETYVEQCMTPQYSDGNYGIAVPAVQYKTASVEGSAGAELAEGEQQEMPRGSYWFSDDEVVEYYTLTQQEYDLFMDLYEKTTSLATFNKSVNEIIRSESEAFFAGQKSAEETARLIQDRVSLYVFEQG